VCPITVVSSLVCNSFRTYLGGEGRHASRSVPWLEWEAPVIRARTHAHTHTHRYKVLEVACTRTHTQIHSAKNDNHAYTDTQCWMWHACMHTQIHSAGSGMHARTQIHSAELANTLYLYVQTHSHQYTYTQYTHAFRRVPASMNGRPVGGKYAYTHTQVHTQANKYVSVCEVPPLASCPCRHTHNFLQKHDIKLSYHTSTNIISYIKTSYHTSTRRNAPWRAPCLGSCHAHPTQSCAGFACSRTPCTVYPVYKYNLHSAHFDITVWSVYKYNLHSVQFNTTV